MHWFDEIGFDVHAEFTLDFLKFLQFFYALYYFLSLAIIVAVLPINNESFVEIYEILSDHSFVGMPSINKVFELI